MTNGRGAWTKTGFPTNGSGYYELLTPVNVGSTPNVDLSHRAVSAGVKAIQTRINELGYTPKLDTDGWLGPLSKAGILWAQAKVAVVADGQVGPRTMTALLWPVIKQIALPKGALIPQAVGGICAHESGFDPGAVGYQDPDDIGLVQINGPSHPTLTEAQRFDYRFAYGFCADVVANALATYKNIDAAIAAYAYPVWGQQWAQLGHAPNPAAQQYVDFVLAWRP